MLCFVAGLHIPVSTEDVTGSCEVNFRERANISLSALASLSFQLILHQSASTCV